MRITFNYQMFEGLEEQSVVAIVLKLGWEVCCRTNPDQVHPGAECNLAQEMLQPNNPRPSPATENVSSNEWNDSSSVF